MGSGTPWKDGQCSSTASSSTIRLGRAEYKVPDAGGWVNMEVEADGHFSDCFYFLCHLLKMSVRRCVGH